MVRSHYFDPTSLDDEVNEDGEKITLDNWKPKPKSNNLVQSEWRKKLIGDNHNQSPDIDDLRKIEGYLKKKTADSEIMRVFGINAETLVAIKKDKYCPIDGISMDNLSKIYKGFKEIQAELDKANNACKYLSEHLFKSKKDLEKYNEFRITGKNKKDVKPKTDKDKKSCDEEE